MHKQDNNDTTSAIALAYRAEPGIIGKKIAVPVDQITAGHPTSLPRTEDSPESLDEDISLGAKRESIDPQHSIVRPAIDTIDREELGAD